MKHEQGFDKREFKSLAAVIILICSLQFLMTATAVGQSSDDCLACHDDADLTTERNGQEHSLFIDPARFEISTHFDLDCVGCHNDLDGFDDFPHDEKLEPVDCGMCHDDIAEIYNNSLHGKLTADGGKLAPECWDCHSAHYVLPPDQPGSQVDRFNIPFMCGRCHKEGTEVTQTYDIPQDSILSHYSLSIHGKGLFEMGLLNTAVCSDCHTAHNVLPHTDPNSSIHRDNVANTCQQCHGRISQVHKKVISGELWESEPHKVPVCVDCHQPHEVRNVFYDEVSDTECMACHGQADISMVREGVEISLHIDSLDLHDSIHKKEACAKCHTGTNPRIDRPCATTPTTVDCSICHAEVVETYNTSTHGMLADRGDLQAPQCVDCHGKHNIKDRRNNKSRTYPLNVPDLCGECHIHGGVAAVRRADRGEELGADNYSMSIHGKGLLESGLVVTAMCTDCHTPHHELPAADTASTVHPDNLSETCAKCHHGIYEKFTSSIHSPEVSDSDKPLPRCSDCHRSHSITRTDTEGFKLEIMEQCGRCHEEVMETYFETYHGKVSKLGYTTAAKCFDCHGSHNILPHDVAASTLSEGNIVATCGQCHEGSHKQFTGFLTHATHNDRERYPVLYYTFWLMTALLGGTMVVAIGHSLLWLPRSLKERKKHKKQKHEFQGHLEFRRFKRLHSILHVMIIVSFLGLVISGMILKFSDMGWAKWLSQVLGGFQSAGFIHRVCAVITFAYFAIHLGEMIRSMIKTKRTIRQFIFGPDSMVPNMNDAREVVASFKWFVGRGPRPQYGRWTYWEKFDYFSVFWGVGIIGATGLLLWFSEFFTIFLPGWVINVATIIHSDEALLATAFIFTVHFFNTHLRPDRFPMDTSIFTGRIPVKELITERPRQYHELVASGKLKKKLIEPLPPIVVKTVRIFGAVALSIGVAMILLIIYAVIIGH